MIDLSKTFFPAMYPLFPRTPFWLFSNRKAFSMACAALLTGSLLALPNLRSAPESTVQVGKGSYTTHRPDPCKPLPPEPFRTDSLKGPIPTNQWWSSLVWKPFSQPLFAHPLAMTCGPEGLGITYTGDAIVGSAQAIMGPAPDGDIKVGLVGVDAFKDARAADFSDWFVTARFTHEKAEMDATFGHGSPYVYLRHRNARVRLSFAIPPELWSHDPKAPVVGLTVRGRHYGLFAPKGSTWAKKGGQGLELQSEGDFMTIALLPSRSPDALKRFAAFAHHHVTNTEVSHQITAGHVVSNYRFSTEAMEGSGSDTFFALYPHQWKYARNASLTDGYRSVRGDMKLGSGTSFQTRIPVHGVLPHLPAEGIKDRQRLADHLAKLPPGKLNAFKDTYWEGKDLGRLATLAGIAEAAGMEDLRAAYLKEVRGRLENWFTASAAENYPVFYYNKTWTSMIGSKPSYGSDEQLNDHHFHYGYFIRAAAEVVRHDPSWANDWGPMVEMLIRDIASSDREDPMFPHLRCFDVYAGHSWASGHADFADGNNQESSSESLNAWYSLILWGEVTGNDRIRDTGICLFNVERTAVEEYWFDVSGTNFAKGFGEEALGMVWGGKGAYATWFSGDADCIYGINWLPFTPASLYMGRHPEYVRRNHDRVVELRPKGDDYNNGWGDLVAMFGALGRPKPAAAYISENPNCSLEGGNTHAFMDHWCHTLDRLGQVDASVTADHPFHAVFEKDGRKTRAVYNFGEKPLTVRFSDGVEIKAAARSMTVSRDGGT